MAIKMDYLDILFKKVNSQLQGDLDALVEMREAEDANPIYNVAYIKMAINQIYYYYNLADEVYIEAVDIAKVRHHALHDNMFKLKKAIDLEISKSGYASGVYDAHTKANRA